MTAWAPGGNYFQETNDQTFILAQIETPEALEKVDEIAAVEGIDCLFIGPADLSCRMSALSRAATFSLDQVVERVAGAARQSNKSWGITAPSLEALGRYRKLGAQLVPWGGDYFLVSVLNQCRQELDGILNPE